LCFGRGRNPEIDKDELEKGDVVLTLVGVAHNLLGDLDGGFFRAVSSGVCYVSEWDRKS
jgi:hypothetical protein